MMSREKKARGRMMFLPLPYYFPFSKEEK